MSMKKKKINKFLSLSEIEHNTLGKVIELQANNFSQEKVFDFDESGNLIKLRISKQTARKLIDFLRKV